MTRFRNHGRMFPASFDTSDAEAKRGTARVQAIDRNLIVGRNTERGWYELWGPSISAGGWVLLLIVSDGQGRPYRANPPWDDVCAAILRGRNGAARIAEEVAEHNERVHEASMRAASERGRDGCEFFRKAVVGEAEGWGKWSGDEVAAAYRRQTYGDKPAPKGRLIFS